MAESCAIKQPLHISINGVRVSESSRITATQKKLKQLQIKFAEDPLSQLKAGGVTVKMTNEDGNPVRPESLSTKPIFLESV